MAFTLHRQSFDSLQSLRLKKLHFLRTIILLEAAAAAKALKISRKLIRNKNLTDQKL